MWSSDRNLLVFSKHVTCGQHIPEAHKLSLAMSAALIHSTSAAISSLSDEPALQFPLSLSDSALEK